MFNHGIEADIKKKFSIKDKIAYILSDKMAVIVFIIIYLKNEIFMNLIKSSGASKLSFQLDTYSLINSYIYILFALLLMSFVFLFKKRTRLWLLVAINMVYSVILVGDLWNFRGFNSFLSLHMLSETQNLNNLSSGVLSMARPIDLVFILDNVVVVILAIIFNKRYKTMEKRKGVFSLVFSFSLVIILFFHAIYDFHGNNYDGPMLFKTQWIPFATMRNLSPLGYHVYDTAAFIDDHRPYQLSSSEKKDIQNWLDYKNEELPNNQYKGIFKGKNLIVIQVESLESFILNQSYDNQEITPNLNKMLKNSIYFSNYNEQVNNGTSSDADLMTNASVYPVRRGSTFFRFPGNQYNTFPKLFESMGYYTEAFHSDFGYYWNVGNALINFGFNKFTGLESFPQKDIYYMGLTDKSFLTQTADMIANAKKPFYAFAVTSTSHMPFEPRADMKSMNLPKDFDSTHMGGYFQDFHYTDEQIGNFINSLDQKGLLDNTVIAIYGDHTSIHKYYGDEVANMKNKESWWGDGWRIPLILYSKGMKGEEIKTIGGQIDIMPTLAYAFGMDKSLYENTTMGRNLLNTNKSYAILSNGTILGKDNLNQKDIDHLDQAFDIADKIIRTDYFNKK
ncbi:LTA synthase family protein [Clostridium sp. 19966]|uniref:LTA synthase family protein n=1 Tax=Clostridium sp. 19966 TaxID=2768166 RepID=UPI0028DDB5FB|nr:LTA synthase family protein [Clostridium sp. 19966]MDT8717325.1 LTA synthase family protein [Clostridium sp. 19966]